MSSSWPCRCRKWGPPVALPCATAPAGHMMQRAVQALAGAISSPLVIVNMKKAINHQAAQEHLEAIVEVPTGQVSARVVAIRTRSSPRLGLHPVVAEVVVDPLLEL